MMFLFTEKSPTSERKGPSLPGKKWVCIMNDIWLCKLSTAENRVSSTLSHLMN